VYEDIGSSVGYRTERREVSVWFIGFGLLAALGAAAASLLWFSRLP
jgi:Ca-activated chloride channel homolog